MSWNGGENRCTVCKQLVSPELLTVITVVFSERVGRKKIKTRVVGWYCEKDREDFPGWKETSEPLAGRTSEGRGRLAELQRQLDEQK